MLRRMHTGLLVALLITTTTIYSVGEARHIDASEAKKLPLSATVTEAAPGLLGNGDPATLRTFKPTPIPFSAPELVNALRGLYRWSNQEVVPQPRSSFDSYKRYVWRDLEPERDRYDFSKLEGDLDKAQAEGRKHSFRVRAMVLGNDPSVPDYMLPLLEKGWRSQNTYIPDWNDPDFMDRVEKLISELGRRYGNDPRISFVDIGIYGTWGEWHTWPFKYPAANKALKMTTENREALINMHLKAFPNVPLVMMTDNVESLIYALKQSPRVGWRRDSLGSDLFGQSDTIKALRDDPATWDLFANRWKTAPVVAEFINPSSQRDPNVYQSAQRQAAEFHVSMVGNGNTLEWDSLSATGRQEFIKLGKEIGYRYELESLTLPMALDAGMSFPFEMRWQNVGNAPTYDYWELTLELRRADSQNVVWQGLTSFDLRTIMPTGDNEAVTFGDTLLIPSSIAAGDYDLYMFVRDPKGYRAPMALAIEGQAADGSYKIGNITVQSEGVSRNQTPQIFLPLVSR